MIYKDIGNDISVNYDGEFRCKGKPKKVIKPISVLGRKCTARICMTRNGKTYYYQAARLVAKAWLPKYREDCCIVYINGDIHNISAYNLKISDKEEYTAYLQRNSGYKAKSLEQKKEKLDLIIKEATLTKQYLESKSFKDINKHVVDRLIPMLKDYCIRTLHLGLSTTSFIVPEAVARMYEVIMAQMCLYNYERYLKKLLYNYKKKGHFGVTGNIPKTIENEVEQLNFDCLCEKYNVKQK